MKQLKKKVDHVYGWNADKGDFHWLIAGDLNSVSQPTPGCADPLVYRFLTSKACGLHSVYRTVLGQEPPLTSVKPVRRIDTIDDLIFSDAMVPSQRQLYTTSRDLCSASQDFRHTIDYLLTSRNLAARGVLNIEVAEDEVDEHEVPWPSDHLPLLADIELLPYG